MEIRIAYGSTKTHAQKQVQINDDIRAGRVQLFIWNSSANIACGSLFSPGLYVPLCGAWKVNISLKSNKKKKTKL